KNLLIPFQFGFKPKLSTTHQLLRAVEHITAGFQYKFHTGAVFLDIQKAFDRPPSPSPAVSTPPRSKDNHAHLVHRATPARIGIVNHWLSPPSTKNYITRPRLSHPLPINAITYITKIFNRCLQLHYFPPSWKIAHVLMFPKPGQNPKLPGNYRPISLLSNLGKIYEKVILSRLKDHCGELNIIPDEQYGFRPQHGCIHQLLRVTNTITHGFNNKHYTGGVFLDVRKAFDRMWHKGLIYKLIANNLPCYLIDIITHYLRDRTFQVKINSILSEPGNIKAGTPQGSILSPLLYTIYTADFPKQNFIINCFFADDTAILVQGSTTKFIIKTLQKGLNEIENWCTLWRIAINTEKT
ncbi:putative RNA-directed DNA polymerase from transposon BS, partial [Araneus ventricosus]